MKRVVILFCAAAAATLFWSQGWTHSGGLDANGGHYNRKTGEYHYHRGGGGEAPAKAKSVEAKPAPSAKSATAGEPKRKKREK